MKQDPSQLTALTQLAQLFLRLGLTAFGGPAAHIAMLHDEAAKRRKWLSEEQFLDLVGATNPVYLLFAGGLVVMLATLGIFLPSFVLVAGGAAVGLLASAL